MKLIYSVPSVVLLIVLSSSVTSAGPITIRPPAGGKVTIEATYRNGGRVTASLRDDGPGDENKVPGIFTFTPPDEANIKTINVVSKGFAFGGGVGIIVADFGVNGLGPLEPLDLPAFAVTDGTADLLALVDVLSLLGFGNPFTTSQIFAATNGVTPLSSAVLFRNASSLLADADPLSAVVALRDPSVVAGLPLFSGTVGVNDPIEFRPVPEPSTVGLFITGAVGLIGSRWRRFKRRRLACFQVWISKNV